jgi:nucleotide-binding universal stress UspA family protein
MNQRRILVAYDGSDEAYGALMQATDAALAIGAAIGIVTVSRDVPGPAHDAARILRAHDIDPEVHTPAGDPATEIARVAHEHAYDTIYVGRPERGSLVRALQRVVAEGVIHAASRTTVIAC